MGHMILMVNENTGTVEPLSEEEMTLLIEKRRAEGQTAIIIGPDVDEEGRIALRAMGIDPDTGERIDPAMVMTEAVGPKPEAPEPFDLVALLTKYGSDKVPSSELFITVAQGDGKDGDTYNFYGLVLRPSTDKEIEAGAEEFTLIAKERGKGHSSKDKARQKAAEKFPTVPVLIGDDQYFYPAYDGFTRGMKIRQQAAERRERRGMTHRPNREGREFTTTTYTPSDWRIKKTDEKLPLDTKFQKCKECGGMTEHFSTCVVKLREALADVARRKDEPSGGM